LFSPGVSNVSTRMTISLMAKFDHGTIATTRTRGIAGSAWLVRDLRLAVA
jgi:hypothetical protein